MIILYAALLWLLLVQRSASVTPRTSVIALLVGSLCLIPYKTRLVQVRDLPIFRASFATSSSLSQRMFFMFRIFALFFVFIINTCYVTCYYIARLRNYCQHKNARLNNLIYG